jgi:hypothetical protein
VFAVGALLTFPNQQGVPWALRKALKLAGVTIQMVQNEAEDGSVISIRAKQVVHPGGFKSDDIYNLDNEIREATVPIFGRLCIRTKYTSLDELEAAELRACLADSRVAKVVVQEFIQSMDNGWSSVGTLGFEEIKGKRYFTRTSIMSNKNKKIELRSVHNFKQTLSMRKLIGCLFELALRPTRHTWGRASSWRITRFSSPVRCS